MPQSPKSRINKHNPPELEILEQESHSYEISPRKGGGSA